jgi:hypothetical protein
MGIREGLRWFVALALALSLATAWSQREHDTAYPDRRTALHGALATTLLALGVVLALRPGPRRQLQVTRSWSG